MISEPVPPSRNWLLDSGFQPKTVLSAPCAYRSAMNCTASTVFLLPIVRAPDSSWMNEPKHIRKEIRATLESSSVAWPIPIGCPSCLQRRCGCAHVIPARG